MECLYCPTEVPNLPGVLLTSQPRVCEECKRRTKREQRRRSRAKKPKKPQTPKKDFPLSIRIRNYVNEIKSSNPCSDCGNKFHPTAMDFDHRPGTEKIKEISKMGTFRAIDVEIQKCDLVCSNCHRIRTHTRKDHLKTAKYT